MCNMIFNIPLIYEASKNMTTILSCLQKTENNTPLYILLSSTLLLILFLLFVSSIVLYVTQWHVKKHMVYSTMHTKAKCFIPCITTM